MTSTVMKTCKTCHTSKVETEFDLNRGYRIGKCKVCGREDARKRSANYRANNYEKRKKQVRDANKRMGKKLYAISRRYQLAKKNRVPPWFEAAEVAAVYARAQQLGLTVDHVVPLQGLKVSGLHCLANLQLLTQSENSAKGNRYET